MKTKVVQHVKSVKFASLPGCRRKLKKVDLEEALLTTDQANVLCDIIFGEEKLVLEDIHLWGVNLRLVDTGKLARAIVRMKKVNLSFSNLTTGQLTVLCQTIVGEKSLALEELGLPGAALRRVDKDLVKRVRKVVKIVDKI